MLSGLSGLSGLSAIAGGSDQIPAPTAFTATPSLGENDLAWTDPVGLPSGSQVNIYYRDGVNGPPWTFLIGVEQGTQAYADTPAADTHRYYKAVGYITSEGLPAYADCLSYPSAPVLGGVSNMQADGSLVLTGVTYGTPSPTGIYVYFNDGAFLSGPYAPGATITVPFSDGAVQGTIGTTVTLTITAVNGSGESAASSGVSVLVSYPQPAQPGVTDDGSGGDLVTWNPTDPAFGAGFVQVYYGPSAGNPSSAMAGSAQTAASGSFDYNPPGAAQQYYCVVGCDTNSTSLSPPSAPGVQGPN